MLKTTFYSATLILILGTAASAESLYAVYPENCVYGSGGEGNIDIGNGSFFLSESAFSRVSERVASGDGYFTATYEQMSEGEAVGRTTLALRITDVTVDVVFPDGQKISANRCS